ncbi:MAG TPA: hypothetical protein VKZ18_17585 [Polyangia bacterium]|nr:hypothetical protein [Polyangia bacterium]
MSNRAFITMALALTSALALASCGKKIGDDCQTAADCDPNGARICDISQPGGYCTILGCDETTCPSEAACIRYFPVQFLTTPCNPYCEDRVGLPFPPDGGSSLDAGMTLDAGLSLDAGVDAVQLPLCPGIFPQDAAGQPDPLSVCPHGPTNDCTADEICLDSGICAPRSTEVRYCARTCSSNGDCRSGYNCRPTGVAGSFLLSSTPCAQTAICVPAN